MLQWKSRHNTYAEFCVHGLSYLACKTYALYYTAIRGLSDSYHNFFLHYILNATIFGEKNCMCISIYRVQNVFLRCPTPRLHCFRHDFRKKILNIKCVFFIFCTNLFEKFLMLRRIQRDVIINVHRPSRTVHVLPVRFETKLNFFDRSCKKNLLSNFIKICSVGIELFLHQIRRGADKSLA